MVFKIRTLSLAEPRCDEDLPVIRGRLRRFSLRELKIATDNFKNIIGKGGFGNVYRGRLPEDGSMVVVKRLVASSSQGEQQFRAEVEVGGIAEHPNLLRLRGYCLTKKERMLVYPFIVNGSLDSLLRSDSKRPPLDWPARKRIALGAARGLAYLHQGCGGGGPNISTIIHRDVKSSNILLDDEFEPIVCDFGLAKFVNPNSYQRSYQNPFVEVIIDEEDSEFDQEEGLSPPENTNNHVVGGLTRFFTKQAVSCWNITRTIVNSEDSNGGDLDQLVPPTQTWSCWQCTRTEVQSNHSNSEPIVLRTRDGDGGGGEIAQPSHSTNTTWANQDFTHVTTMVCGTSGYLDPVYCLTGKCSVKSDVYGYGITLLEIISGQKAIDRDRGEDVDRHIAGFFNKKLRDNELHLLLDPHILMGNCHYFEEEVWQVIQVAQLCVQASSVNRPTMPEVIHMLQGIFWAEPNVCLPFDRANLFGFNLNPVYESEAGSRTDSSTFETEGSGSFDQDQANEMVHIHGPVTTGQDTSISSKGKEVVAFSGRAANSKAQQARFQSQSNGVAISDHIHGPVTKVQDASISSKGKEVVSFSAARAANSIAQQVRFRSQSNGVSISDHSHKQVTIEQDASISSKGKEVVPFLAKEANSKAQEARFGSQPNGISISNHIWEAKIQEKCKAFLSDMVSDALPTKHKLCKSGMSVDPLCPLCNQHEEDAFHLFFKCDFSKQAWQLAVGIRIDLLGFGSVKDAVDMILKPNAETNIIPPGLELRRFSYMGVAVLYSVWNHRNKVCFDKVSPDVREMVSSSLNLFLSIWFDD